MSNLSLCLAIHLYWATSLSTLSPCIFLLSYPFLYWATYFSPLPPQSLLNLPSSAMLIQPSICLTNCLSTWPLSTSESPVSLLAWPPLHLLSQLSLHLVPSTSEPPVSLLGHPSIYWATVSLFVHPSICWATCLTTCPPIHLLSHLSIYLSIHPSTEPPVSLLGHPSICNEKSLKILWDYIVAHLTIGASCETGVDHSHSPRGYRAAPRPTQASESYCHNWPTQIQKYTSLTQNNILEETEKAKIFYSISVPPLAYLDKASTFYTKRRKTKKEKEGCRYPFVLTSIKNARPSLKFLFHTFCMYVIVWS